MPGGIMLKKLFALALLASVWTAGFAMTGCASDDNGGPSSLTGDKRSSDMARYDDKGHRRPDLD
jgi:hypothetical protein